MPASSRRGGTSLEFALTLPIFLLITFGVMDIGWLYYMKSTLDSSTSTGCRAGALIDPGEGDSNVAAMAEAAETRMKKVLDAYAVGPGYEEESVNAAAKLTGSAPSRTLVCTMSMKFNPLVGIALDPMTLESAMAVRIEWQRE